MPTLEGVAYCPHGGDSVGGRQQEVGVGCVLPCLGQCPHWAQRRRCFPQTALPPSASQEAWLTSADRAMWFVNSWGHGGKQVKFSKGRFWSSEFLL